MTIGFAYVALHMGPDGPVRAFYRFRPVLSGELHKGGGRCSVFPLVDGRSGPWDGVTMVVEGYGTSLSWLGNQFFHGERLPSGPS